MIENFVRKYSKNNEEFHKKLLTKIITYCSKYEFEFNFLVIIFLLTLIISNLIREYCRENVFDEIAYEMMEYHNKNKKSTDSTVDSDIRNFRNLVARKEIIRILNEGMKEKQIFS
jgi:hypothetical protein